MILKIAKVFKARSRGTIVTAIFLLETNEVYRIQCKCSYGAIHRIVTTSPTLHSPLVPISKSRSQSLHVNRP